MGILITPITGVVIRASEQARQVLQEENQSLQQAVAVGSPLGNLTQEPYKGLSYCLLNLIVDSLDRTAQVSAKHDTGCFQGP